MKTKKWGIPPALEMVLKLQKIHQKLRHLEIKSRLERAEKLLRLHLKQAKKKLDGE